MSARAYKLLNASELRFLQETLLGVAKTWAAAWLPDDAAVQSRCAQSEEARALADKSRWLCCSGVKRGRVFIPITNGLEKCFATVVFGNVIDNLEPTASGPSDVLVELLSRALSDLAQRLFEFANPEAVSVSTHGEAPAPMLWKKGSGAVAAALTLHDEVVHVVLDTVCVAALLRNRPREARRLAPLDQRTAGLGAQRAELRIWIGAATIEFGVLQSLARGDVVKLDTDIRSPMKISITGEDTPLIAYLGSIEGYKAIQLSADKH